MQRLKELLQKSGKSKKEEKNAASSAPGPLPPLNEKEASLLKDWMTMIIEQRYEQPDRVRGMGGLVAPKLKEYDSRHVEAAFASALVDFKKTHHDVNEAALVPNIQNFLKAFEKDINAQNVINLMKKTTPNSSPPTTPRGESAAAAAAEKESPRGPRPRS